MSIADRERWEERHRTRSLLTPRESVRSILPPPSNGAIALDLACGQGRHSGPLLQLGYRVVAFDVSLQALRRAPAPPARSPHYLAIQGDADAWPFAENAFDAIVQVDFLDRALFSILCGSLKRGGFLLIDTFLNQGHRNAEGPSRSDFLLSEGELPGALPELRMLQYEEHRGASARAVYLGRKP